MNSLTDIQVRNRYFKEIQILIKRIDILQEQEKSYKNLDKEILLKKEELKDINTNLNEIKKYLEDNTNKNTQLKENIWYLEWIKSDLEEDCKNIQLNKEKINKEYREQEISIWELNNNIEKEKKNINNEFEHFKEDNLKKKQEIISDYAKANYEYINLEEKIRLDKIEIEKNKELIAKQREEITKLKTEFNELDKEYKKLLELYILKS